jgi:3-phenylpropionate/trans-cinnamate dioxygenase ferredoxin reductase subunit
MATEHRVVIVGGGQAGARSAAALRKAGFEGAISLVGEEAVLPYERPPLSKEVLLGSTDPATLRIYDDTFYRDQRVDLLLGSTVAGFDVAARTVQLAGARTLAYDKLVLATGARARTIEIAGIDHDRILTLRSIADAKRLRQCLQAGQRVVLIGGGFIGLEVAASAARNGCRVTVIEARPQLIERAIGPVVASRLAALHRQHGVILKTTCAIERGQQSASGLLLLLSDGSRVEADVIIAGIGAIPNMELAMHAGLSCSTGIHVDASCRTSAPHVFAAGDVACQFNPLYGERLRLESWENAEHQAAIAAAAILGSWHDDAGVDAIAAPDRSRLPSWVPWFWTDQFDLNLQIVGLVAGSDRVAVRGNPDSAAFLIFHFRQDRLTGAELFNCGRERRVVRQLVASGSRFDEKALADPAIPLKTLLG